MKFIDGLNFVKDLNEKLYNNETVKNSPYCSKYFETLHSSMVEFFRAFTEKDYKEISLMFRNSIEKIEIDLLLLCGQEYKEEYDKYLLENGKFRQSSTNISNNKSKYKNQIGFVAENDEGINV